MKPLFIILAIFVVNCQIFACRLCNEKEKGLIPDWKFAPVQVGLGIDGYRNLVDYNTNTIFTFGLWGMEQKSAICTFSPVGELENNYGIQFSAFSCADSNYGLQIGFENCSDVDVSGLKIGVFNCSGKAEYLQLLGISFFDMVQLGIANYNSVIQFGIFNLSGKKAFQIGIFNATLEAGFQIGLLNYNSKSYIPWLPLVNWDMGREEQ